MNVDKTIRSAFKYYQTGNVQQAAQICKKILSKKPNNIDALHLLGVIHYQGNDYGSAIKYFSKAVQLNPQHAEALNNLGFILQETGQLDEAMIYIEKAVHIKPDYAEAHNHMGIILQKKGEIDRAIVCYQKALQINPYLSKAHSNLGVALQKKGLPDATLYFKKALDLDNSADAYNNLANDLLEKGLLSEAIHCYERSIAVNPGSEYSYNNLGNAYKDKGELPEAEQYYRRALQINQHYLTAHSNILLTMHYDTSHSPDKIFAEHIKFAHQFEKPLSSQHSPYLNEVSSGRKLRIGYISPDFKRHSVAYFVEPVLAGHDHNKFEIFCYADVLVPDGVTKRFQRYADNWMSITGKSDEEVAALIREHKIDILVDLSGHTANNRMLVFARKPAPVQVTWIGYPATTGLSSIDYKIVDNYTDPSGLTEQYYTEKLVRLPKSFLCYIPDKESPDVRNFLSLKSGQVTFCSCNNFSKISADDFGVWTTILQRVQASRLIIKAKSLADSALCTKVKNTFSDAGIHEDRIELLPWIPTSREHLDTYNRVDIALDTFPYNGTTTTCEALWMGVPVITLAGNTHASRVGVSLLSNVGVPELVARTPEEYVNIAVELAWDTDRLNWYRSNLRNMMTDSPLTDAKRFTANLELSFRQMWETWCESV